VGRSGIGTGSPPTTRFAGVKISAWAAASGSLATVSSTTPAVRRVQRISASGPWAARTLRNAVRMSGAVYFCIFMAFRP
jgi:hypothetical protein